MAICKGNFARLIDRIKRFGLKGFESPIQTPEIPQTAPTPESTTLVATTPAAAQADVLRPFTNPLELRVETEFGTTIEAFSDSDKQTYLLKAVVRMTIQLHFEKTFQTIYRSQIVAMEFLNGAGLTAPRNTVKIFYDTAADGNPDLYAHYPFERWLDFLVRAYLVRLDPESVSLTADGRDPEVPARSWVLSVFEGELVGQFRDRGTVRWMIRA